MHSLMCQDRGCMRPNPYDQDLTLLTTKPTANRMIVAAAHPCCVISCLACIQRKEEARLSPLGHG